MAQDKIKAIALGTVPSAGMPAAYNVSHSYALAEPCSMIRIMNATNQAVTISYDGLIDNEYMFPDTTLQIEAQRLSQPSNYRCLFAKDTPIYFKGTAGAGTIYISGYYQN